MSLANLVSKQNTHRVAQAKDASLPPPLADPVSSTGPLSHRISMGSLGSVASSVAALPILELPVLEDVNSRQVWGGEGVGAGMFGLCEGVGAGWFGGGMQAGVGCVRMWGAGRFGLCEVVGAGSFGGK